MPVADAAQTLPGAAATTTRRRILLGIALAVATGNLAAYNKFTPTKYLAAYNIRTPTTKYFVAIEFPQAAIESNRSSSFTPEVEHESFSACLLWMDDNHRLVEWYGLPNKAKGRGEDAMWNLFRGCDD